MDVTSQESSECSCEPRIAGTRITSLILTQARHSRLRTPPSPTAPVQRHEDAVGYEYDYHMISQANYMIVPRCRTNNYGIPVMK